MTGRQLGDGNVELSGGEAENLLEFPQEASRWYGAVGFVVGDLIARDA